MSYLFASRCTLSFKRLCTSFLLLATALIALNVLGCLIVPMRVPTRTKDISGSSQKLDFSFLKARVTTREDVNKNLYAIDTHLPQTDFFWGRWEQSKWGVGGAVVTPYGPNAGGSRMWSVMNLLVSFDKNGVVSKQSFVNDKELSRQLELFEVEPSLQTDIKLEVRTEVLLPVIECCDKPNPVADLAISSDFFECGSVKTPWSNVQKITPTSERTSGHARYIWITVHFLSRTAGRKGVKSFVMGVDPKTFLVLSRYGNQRSQQQS